MGRASAVSIFSAVVRYASPMLIYFQGIMRFALHFTNIGCSGATVRDTGILRYNDPISDIERGSKKLIRINQNIRNFVEDGGR